MEHLGPKRRRLDAVGAGEVVEQAGGRVLKQAVPERLEALDDLSDQRPGPCAVAGQPSARVGDTDADVAHLVPHREPLRLAQAGERADPIELRRDEVLVCTPDRSFANQVVGDDGLQEAVLVAARLERAGDVVERRIERGRDGIELRIRKPLTAAIPPSTAKTSEYTRRTDSMWRCSSATCVASRSCTS